MTSTDYHVVNAVGTVLYTSPDKDLAKDYARANGATFPGLRVQEVIVTETRRTVWSDRSHLRLVGAA